MFVLNHHSLSVCITHAPSLVLLFVKCRDSLSHYVTEEKVQSACSRLENHLHFRLLIPLFSAESYLVLLLQ